MKIRLAADLQTDSIVDGPGIRTVIWTQGCPHQCPGCHNPMTHSFEDGCLVDVDLVKEEISSLSHQTGVTFSGGDPMCQPEACLALAKHCKQLNLDVWFYTGYTYEQIVQLAKQRTCILELLTYIDVLVDGKFILDEKSLNLEFKGSRNQRVIDVPRTLETGIVTLYERKKIPIKGNKKPQGVYI